jgi:hypothetical protein
MHFLPKEIWAGGCRQEPSNLRVIPVGTKSLRFVLVDAYSLTRRIAERRWNPG